MKALEVGGPEGRPCTGLHLSANRVPYLLVGLVGTQVVRWSGKVATRAPGFGKEGGQRSCPVLPCPALCGVCAPVLQVPVAPACNCRPIAPADVNVPSARLQPRCSPSSITSQPPLIAPSVQLSAPDDVLTLQYSRSSAVWTSSSMPCAIGSPESHSSAASCSLALATIQLMGR